MHVPSAQADSPPNALQGVHDPCIAKAKGYYYLYSTGAGIPIRRSSDLIHWQMLGRVFSADEPDWARQEIPGSRGIWAPDISYFAGRFHLYYAVSRFGTNQSVIGLATNTTLDPADKNYRWVDEGMVLETHRSDDYNAIDPNIVLTGRDRAALDFGSFWSGIKLIMLDVKTGRPAPDAKIVSLAQRPPPDAIEAPFLIRHRDRYYLFVSFDLCCRGTDSTYNIRVGRAKDVAGPYVDRDGKTLLSGGGTLVLGSQGDVIGPGHCAVLQTDKGDYLIHHFYDGAKHGMPTLQVRPLTWTADGWPVAGSPLTPS
jgi:arabinan endo-1,5-alpha-L-arabinosidase